MGGPWRGLGNGDLPLPCSKNILRSFPEQVRYGYQRIQPRTYKSLSELSLPRKSLATLNSGRTRLDAFSHRRAGAIHMSRSLSAPPIAARYSTICFVSLPISHVLEYQTYENPIKTITCRRHGRGQHYARHWHSRIWWIGATRSASCLECH